MSPIASLRFFEFAFSSVDDKQTEDAVKSETNLFKAYLQFVTMETNKDAVSDNYLQELTGKYRIAATLLNQTYPVSDFTNYSLSEIFITQLIKSFYLFNFLENEPKAVYLLNEFYLSLGLKDWKEYFQFIVPLIEAHSKHPSEGWTQVNVERNEKFKRACFFLDALSLRTFDAELDADFKLLRGNPLYKIEEGKYSIISPLFVFEKVYKGLYFKLKEVYDSIPNEKRVIDNFRVFYTSNFSENYLLYKILKHIYGHRKYIQYSGEELANQNFSGAPDYYIRNGNTVFLFENKDVFINADIKQSFNFKILEEELKKKFYQETKGEKIKPKAVLQLAKNVEKILTNQNAFDKFYRAKNLKIYPILVVHDSSFNCPGLNSVINEWFEYELKKLGLKNIDTSKVRPITIVNIDTLILYADYLNIKKERLEDLIEAYIKFGIFNDKKKYRDFEDVKSANGKSLLSFSFFMNQYTTVGYRNVPKALETEIMISLFPDEKKDKIK